MRITFVRHARSQDFEEGRHQRRESALSAAGKEQARRVGERLKTHRFDKAFVSPYTRTHETWEEIATHHPELEVEFLELLTEQKKGIYEGKKVGPYLEEIERSNLPFGRYRPEQGENLLDVRERVERFWELLTAEEVDSILVVGHGAFFTTLFLRLHGKELAKEEYDAFEPENTAVTIIEVKGKKATFISLNETDHL